MIHKCLHTRYGLHFWILLHVVKTLAGKIQWSISLILSFCEDSRSGTLSVALLSTLMQGFESSSCFSLSSICFIIEKYHLKWAFSRMHQNPSNMNLAFLLVSAMDFVFKVSNEYSTRTYSLLFWLYWITPKLSRRSIPYMDPLSRIQMVHYIF